MKNIIIYGAGNMGRAYYSFLEQMGFGGTVEAFCDRKAGEFLKGVCEKPVLSYEIAKDQKLPFLIGIQKDARKEIMQTLTKDNIPFYSTLDEIIVDELQLMSRADYERRFCEFYHIESMNQYFESADTEGGLHVFWDEGSCYSLFRRLNPRNIVELACGRGRHVPKYYSLAERITLVDVLGKNIQICKERFKAMDNISYYVNNGMDLSKLPRDTYTAIFSYDSMVHFELPVIDSYLKEAYRILASGGMALFHHSNNHTDYKASFDNGTEGRSFMGKNLFAHLAYRQGFRIIEQRLLEWNHIKDLDCLTLLQKM